LGREGRGEGGVLAFYFSYLSSYTAQSLVELSLLGSSQITMMNIVKDRGHIGVYDDTKDGYVEYTGLANQF
jgi:hypothetical protein